MSAMQSTSAAQHTWLNAVQWGPCRLLQCSVYVYITGAQIVVADIVISVFAIETAPAVAALPDAPSCCCATWSGLESRGACCSVPPWLPVKKPPAPVCTLCPHDEQALFHQALAMHRKVKENRLIDQCA